MTTIAAVATPPGSGGIAIVRLSGPDAISVAAQIYRGTVPLQEAESHRVHLGEIIIPPPTSSQPQQPEMLDEVLITVFRAPASFTGEDVVEISCHGGLYLTRRILDLVVSRGARLAERGEFSMRAFLNGKLDLTQVEAVADLIAARTAFGLGAATAQYQGALSRKVSSLRVKLIDICSLLELELDFSEEDVELASKDMIAKQLQQAEGAVSELVATYRRGRVSREGARLVIVGKPNVGKSSLMNALLKMDRAIVTELPGTTRDVIEELLDIRGVLFRLIDTAGIRATDNVVEKSGVMRSLEQIKLADVILVVFDGSTELDAEDEIVIARIRKESADARRAIVAVLNKMDLKSVVKNQQLRKRVHADSIVRISATEHLGMESLETALLRAAVGSEDRVQGDAMVTNIRQRNALERGRASLLDAYQSLMGGLSGEFVAADLHDAIDAIGEIVGEVTTEEILDNIFSKFCIGK